VTQLAVSWKFDTFPASGTNRLLERREIGKHTHTHTQSTDDYNNWPSVGREREREREKVHQLDHLQPILVAER